MAVNHELSRAIVQWTGWGSAVSPVRDDSRITGHSGNEGVAALVQQVHSLEEDFYRSNAYLTAPDLATMGAVAAGEFRQGHPDISDDAVAALAWCYTYDYK